MHDDLIELVLLCIAMLLNIYHALFYIISYSSYLLSHSIYYTNFAHPILS